MGVVGEGRGRILTPGQVAEILKVDPKTVTRYAREGHLPSFRLPGPRGHRRFWEQDVLDVLDTTGRGSAPMVSRGQLDLPLEM